jgi:anti-sigma regulatory factor (Ser/Thr protein kinase)
MDVNQPHHRFVITDRSYSSLAKRDVIRLAEGLNFSSAEIAKINIIVAEMTSNLAKHATKGGELLVKPLGNPVQGLEILALDNGPGMANPLHMLEDGVSTYGSAGEGLGAIKRQSSIFDLYSQPGMGTVVLSRLMKATAPPFIPGLFQPPDRYEVSTVTVAKPGETACGDGYAVVEIGRDLHLLALDGLGHGIHARDAIQLAIKTFMQAPKEDPAYLLRHLHEEIRSTRGAVGFLAHIDGGTQVISYCGIGNISGKILLIEGGPTGSTAKSIMSYNGIIGHNIPNQFNSQEVDWGPNKIMILHSDGLKTKWDLNTYPSLYRHHPSVIAAVLYTDNSRKTDDSLVMVCKAKI